MAAPRSDDRCPREESRCRAGSRSPRCRAAPGHRAPRPGSAAPWPPRSASRLRSWNSSNTRAPVPRGTGPPGGGRGGCPRCSRRPRSRSRSCGRSARWPTSSPPGIHSAATAGHAAASGMTWAPHGAHPDRGERRARAWSCPLRRRHENAGAALLRGPDDLARTSSIGRCSEAGVVTSAALPRARPGRAGLRRACGWRRDPSTRAARPIGLECVPPRRPGEPRSHRGSARGAS